MSQVQVDIETLQTALNHFIGDLWMAMSAMSSPRIEAVARALSCQGRGRSLETKLAIARQLKARSASTAEPEGGISVTDSEQRAEIEGLH